MERDSFQVQGAHVGDGSTVRQGHIYNAPVTINQADKAEPVPSIVCDIPDLLTRHFVGRVDALARIQDALDNNKSDSPARCIIYGLPGQGKTQLALKYAESVYAENRVPYIFWMSAASPDKVVQGFSRLLDLVAFPGRQNLDQQARCVEACRWLENRSASTERRWLLVLDNANRDTASRLWEMLPRCNTSGSLLFTTRTQSVAETLATAFQRQHACIELTALETSEAVELFSSISEVGEGAQDKAQQRDTEELVKLVGRLPLAIDQAASFLAVSQMPVSKLMEIYKSEKLPDALEWENELSRYSQKSVMATYTFAIEELQHGPPGLIDLLRIAVFLDPEYIPLALLKEGCTSVRALLENQMELHKALSYGQRLSLVQVLKQDDEIALRIHDLVHLILRRKLMASKEECKEWLLCTLSTISNTYKEWGIEPKMQSSWNKCEQVLPHVRALQTSVQEYEVNEAKFLGVCRGIGAYLGSQGRYDDAAKVFEQNLAQFRMLRGNTHPEILNYMKNMVLAYYGQNKLEAAETLAEEALQGSIKILGRRSPDTLEFTCILSDVYLKQGRSEDACRLIDEAAELFGELSKLFGLDDFTFARAMYAMASSSRRAGRFEYAVVLQERILDARKVLYGPEHVSTLNIMHDLAITYIELGRLGDAEGLQVQVLEVEKRTGGANNLRAVDTMRELARMYAQQKRWDEAIALLQDALRVLKLTLGEDHWRTQNTAKYLQERIAMKEEQSPENAHRLSLSISQESRSLDHDD